MPVKRFIDTNILLYAYDLDAGRKRDIAQEILADAWRNNGSAAISVQVLQEFHVNFTRKGGAADALHQIIEDLSLWPVVDNTLELFGHGLAIKEQFGLSLWDSMIVAAANQSGAAELITEDLNHGQDYGSVRAIDPFKD
ncbi:MAG: PIN domain-containing protein [Opitutales bacterium]